LEAPAVKATERVPLLGVIDVMVGAAGVWATRTEVRVGALKVRLEMEFVARSRIVPELRSKVVETAMPSVSISLEEVCTAYVNVSVLLLLPDA
jgi:hypothetical protein